MWREAGLRWKDFLPEDEDVNKFVTEKVMADRAKVRRRKAPAAPILRKRAVTFEQNVEFTLGEENETGQGSKKELSSAELSKQLERLIRDQADNQRVFDWIEVRTHGTGKGGGEKKGITCVCRRRPTWTSSRRPPTRLSEL